MGFETRDPIYGDIVLSEEEARLLDTFEMQRLRRVRQLGNVALVYHSANHTRFEHSLGTRWLIQKIIRISNLPVGKYDEKILYKCALLHDIAEPAFAHAMERLKNQGFPTHEEIVDNVLNGAYKEKVLEKREVKAKFVCDVITRDKEREEIRDVLTSNPKQLEKPFMRELLNGYIDADNLEYLRRDSFFLGLAQGNYDDRIFASFRIVRHEDQEHIAFRNSQDTINSIMSILDSRFTLRKAAYLHHAVIIADDLLLQAARLALDPQEGAIDGYDIFLHGDYELLYKMAQSKAAFPFVEDLLDRYLPKRVYVLDGRTPSNVEDQVNAFVDVIRAQSNFAATISGEAKVKEEDVNLHLPVQSGWKDFQLVLLVSDDGTVKTLGEEMPDELSLLEKKYKTFLWGFMVSTNELDYEKRVAVHGACVKFFGYKGSFYPKKTLRIEEIESELTPLIDGLRDEVPSAMAVLRVLIRRDKPLSRDEIAEELDLEPATVSHYLTLIDLKLSKTQQPVLTKTRIRRQKLWSLNSAVREAIDHV
jgi:hypothetical protein